jgi:hypothetical protein
MENEKDQEKEVEQEEEVLTQRVSADLPLGKSAQIRIGAVRLGLNITEFIDRASEEYLRRRGLIDSPQDKLPSQED